MSESPPCPNDLHDRDHPLMSAVINGDAAIVKKLLDDGANANAKDKGGLTVLMWAAGNGHFDIVQPLLDAGAEVNTKA